MQAKLVAAILGITEARQTQVIQLITEAVSDFVHKGLYNEETLLQVLAVHTQDFTQQEKSFALYFAGRYTEKILGSDMPLDESKAFKQIYQNDELHTLPTGRY